MDASVTDRGLAGEDGVQRDREVGVCILLVGKGVVDRAVIGDLPGLRIDYEGFARLRDAERAANQLEFIGRARADRPNRARRRTCRASTSGSSRAS